MTFDIITIFPDIFNSYFNESILKIAQEKRLIKINIHNLRDYTTDKHKIVDDRPYGGGPGMILKIEPIYRALKNLAPEAPRMQKAFKSMKYEVRSKKNINSDLSFYASQVVMLDPAGKKFNQPMAQKFSKLDRLVLLCGRYEGFDNRVTKLVDERISIGDYVLAGGELPAMIITEAVARLIPGVIGKTESLKEETFCEKDFVEYPQYTRPETFCPDKNICWEVPKVLLGGNHKKINEWRKKRAGSKNIKN